MRYPAFRDYQAKQTALAKHALDNLNVYGLAALLPAKPSTTLHLPTGYVWQNSGVRHALRCLLPVFQQHMGNQQLLLPNDIYPEYQRIVHAYSDRPYLSYSAAQEAAEPDYLLTLLNTANCMLVTSPSSPSGNYLPPQQMEQIRTWLEESTQRWLVIDSAYDFLQLNTQHFANFQRTIILGTQTKISLRPQTDGWAWMSEASFQDWAKLNQLNFVQEQSYQVHSHAEFLETYFKQHWANLSTSLPFNFTPPDTGYMTNIDIDWRTLRDEYQVAAVPRTVYWDDDRSLPKGKIPSVISCLPPASNH